MQKFDTTAPVAAVPAVPAGRIRLIAADGDVEVGRLTGPAEISTARGDIRIAEANNGTVTTTTQAIAANTPLIRSGVTETA
ncbi:hypothetical protein ACH4ZU_24950 [Streptomyces sp. NPDC020472]|uniref:hypothetical protein n=1 Tax=Streptomyces sp. NPDC020472 TaxID=3365075 RepID=UPI0037952FF4